MTDELVQCRCPPGQNSHHLGTFVLFQCNVCRAWLCGSCACSTHGNLYCKPCQDALRPCKCPDPMYFPTWMYALICCACKHELCKFCGLVGGLEQVCTGVSHVNVDELPTRLGFPHRILKSDDASYSQVGPSLARPIYCRECFLERYRSPQMPLCRHVLDFFVPEEQLVTCSVCSGVMCQCCSLKCDKCGLVMCGECSKRIEETPDEHDVCFGTCIKCFKKYETYLDEWEHQLSLSGRGFRL